MQLDDSPSPDHAAALEAENAFLRQGLADAGLRNRHMLHELQHRARNTFAVVRSIVRRTATTSHTVEDYAMHLTGRLDAVARAEAMTSFDPQGSACLQSLLLEELLAHAMEEGDQVSLDGPSVRLRGKAAEMLALALHELTVNAVKFGALSTPEGRVAVRWGIDPAPAGDAAGDVGGDGRVLRLAWREAGAGVADAPAGPRGFGTEMIERTLAYELGATASLGFGREGAWCDIAVPLADTIVVPGAGP
ncbi:MAG: HWE histidine kinase domain-containing protein [Janthinobacterium lividum]